MPNMIFPETRDIQYFRPLINTCTLISPFRENLTEQTANKRTDGHRHSVLFMIFPMILDSFSGFLFVL